MEEIQVDEQIVDRIVMRVLFVERKNLITEKYNLSQLVSQHINIIKEYTKELVP